MNGSYLTEQYSVAGERIDGSQASNVSELLLLRVVAGASFTAVTFAHAAGNSLGLAKRSSTFHVFYFVHTWFDQ